MAISIRSMLAQISPTAAGADLQSTLAELSGSSVLANELQRSAEDPSLATEIAGRSYLHPNGFVKVVVQAASASGPRLRIHHWFKPDGSDLTIHDHCWNFASHVIAGRLRMATFEPTASRDTGGGYHKWRIGNLANAERRYFGTHHLRQTEETALYSGSLYSLESSTLHTFLEAPAATLSIVLQGWHINQSSTIYSQRHLDNDPYTVTRPSVVSVVGILKRTSALLSSPSN